MAFLEPARDKINWTRGDGARGTAVFEAMLLGRRVWTKADAYRGMVEALARAELVRGMAAGRAPVGGSLFGTFALANDVAVPTMTVLNGATSDELEPLPDEVELAYLAMRRACESLFYTARLVHPTTPTIDIAPNVPALAPVVIALTVVGIAAIAATAWFAAESEEQKVELEKHRISTLAQVDLYLKDLAARIAAGQPLPPPPSSVLTAGEVQKNTGALMLTAGLLLGGASVAGVIVAMRKGSSAPTASNPHRRRAARAFGRRARARAALPAAPLAANPTKRRRKRKRNPLAKGYSRKTVGKNIARERKAGTSAPQAVAMSLSHARKAYRKVHPTGPWPAHLRPPKRAKKASAGRRAGKTRRNAKSARRRGATIVKKRTRAAAPKLKRRLNAKKRSPKRAQNATPRKRVSKKTVARRVKPSAKRRGNASRPRVKRNARRAPTMRGARAKRRRKAGSTATRRRSRTSSRKRTSRRA